MHLTATNKQSRIFTALVSSLCLAISATCWAGGGQHYANGTTDFVMAALPPAGVYLENHLLFVHKDRLVDDSGDRLPVDFSVDAVVEAPRILYVTPYTLFGASLAMHVAVPFYSADMEISTSPASPGDIVNSDEANTGDIIFSPLVLGWHHSPNFHYALVLDLFAPTGDYDSMRPATQIFSRNHWTIEPAAAITYLWKGFDFSTRFGYDFHTENDDYLNPATGQEVELKPGQEFHVDWAVGYAPKDGLRFGVVGYNHWQITDDEIDGVEVADQKSRLGAVGGGIKYWPKGGPFSLTLKHYWEYGGENIAMGQNTQFKINYAF